MYAPYSSGNRSRPEGYQDQPVYAGYQGDSNVQGRFDEDYDDSYEETSLQQIQKYEGHFIPPRNEFDDGDYPMQFDDGSMRYKNNNPMRGRGFKPRRGGPGLRNPNLAHQNTGPWRSRDDEPSFSAPDVCLLYLYFRLL